MNQTRSLCFFWLGHGCRRRSILRDAGALLISLICASPGVASDSVVQTQVIQVVADVTLIDNECRTLNATFGTVFRYAEEHGVHWADLMPLGSRRAEFNAAAGRRLQTTSHDDLCGPLAQHYGEQFPGLFTAR